MKPNPFDEFDDQPYVAHKPAAARSAAPATSIATNEERFVKPNKAGQVQILMQEYQSIMAQPPGPRRDADVASVARELRNLGVSLPAPTNAPAAVAPVAAPVAVAPAPVAAPAPVMPVAVRGVDARGRLTAENDPRVRAMAAPRRGSLRALAQATPGVQMAASPEAQALESSLASGVTAGTDIYARAMYHKMMTGDTFERSLQAARAQQQALEGQFPGIANVGRAVGNTGLAIATGGASIPRQIAVAGAIPAAQKFTESADTSALESGIAGAVGAGTAGALAGAGKLVEKGARAIGNLPFKQELNTIAQFPKKKNAKVSRYKFTRKF
jgi:hypothetical protein